MTAPTTEEGREDRQSEGYGTEVRQRPAHALPPDAQQGRALRPAGSPASPGPGASAVRVCSPVWPGSCGIPQRRARKSRPPGRPLDAVSQECPALAIRCVSTVNPARRAASESTSMWPVNCGSRSPAAKYTPWPSKRFSAMTRSGVSRSKAAASAPKEASMVSGPLLREGRLLLAGEGQRRAVDVGMPRHHLHGAACRPAAKGEAARGPLPGIRVDVERAVDPVRHVPRQEGVRLGNPAVHAQRVSRRRAVGIDHHRYGRHPGVLRGEPVQPAPERAAGQPVGGAARLAGKEDQHRQRGPGGTQVGRREIDVGVPALEAGDGAGDDRLADDAVGKGPAGLPVGGARVAAGAPAARVRPASSGWHPADLPFR